MTQEQERTLSALKTAIQMEIDGKEFYLDAAKSSTNDMGKKLLGKLADEEDIHRRVFENIYHALSDRKGWPEKTVHKTEVKTILSEMKDQAGKDFKPRQEEIDAVQTAIGLETKTFDYYEEQAKKASYPAEKEYFQSLALQEHEHHKALLSYYEFLKDPQAWFVEMEHPSLDGG